MEIVYREIDPSDFYNGFFTLINFFTKKKQNEVSYIQFCKQLEEIKLSSVIYVACLNNKIIGTAKLLIEPKFHNNFASVGHIEDVVVTPDFYNMGIGRKLVAICVNRAKQELCYKIVLETKKELCPFYEKNGFQIKGIEMCIYL